MNTVNRYMDEKGRIKLWASKQNRKLEILQYFATKFEPGRICSEKEVNSIIESWHTFGDYVLIRRELIDNSFLSRTSDCSKYWVEEKSDDEAHVH